jgi:hypothetical protein
MLNTVNIKGRSSFRGSTHERNEKCIHILVGKLKGGDHLEDLGIDGKIILEWILGK